MRAFSWTYKRSGLYPRGIIAGRNHSEEITESRLLNAHGWSFVVRGQNENWAAARREEDVSEPRSVVNRVGKNFNFWFILKCMLLFARFFPIQFLKLTGLNYHRHATVKQRVRWGWLRSLHDFYDQWHLYICRSLFGHSTFFVGFTRVYAGHFVLCYKEEC